MDTKSLTNTTRAGMTAALIALANPVPQVIAADTSSSPLPGQSTLEAALVSTTNQPVVISMTTAPGTFQGQSNYVFNMVLNAKDIFSPSLTNYNTWGDNTSLAGGEYHPEGGGTLTVTDGSGNRYTCGLTNMYLLFSNTEIIYMNQYGMIGAGANIIYNPTNDWTLTNRDGVAGPLSSFLLDLRFWSPVPVRSFKKPWLSKTNLSKWEGLAATFFTASEGRIDEYQTTPAVSVVFPAPVVERQLQITTTNTTSKLYGKAALRDAWQLISSNPPPWKIPLTNAVAFYTLGQ